MTDEVYWVLELEVKAGRDADFQALKGEMIAATEANEPGTLSYEWTTSEDGRRCHIYERYRDSTALLTHLATFGERFAQRFLDILTPTRFVVYGTPTPAAREGLAGLEPIYFGNLSGFSRRA